MKNPFRKPQNITERLYRSLPLAFALLCLVRVVPGAAHETKLLPATLVAGAHYGESVALDGPWSVFGAPDHTQNGPLSGAAFVYSHDSPSFWTEVARLGPLDVNANDNFGNAVAISGSNLLIGAHWEDPGGVSDGGSAYVFGDSILSGWVETAKLDAAPPIEETDHFGVAVTIEGSFAAATAPNKNLAGADSGAAYVFYDDPVNGWQLTEVLRPPDIVAGDKLGSSVAMNGTELAVGANQDTVGLIRPGSVYLYRRDASGTYLEEQQLMASPPEDGAQFGSSVSVSGNTLAVGSTLSDASEPDAGAVFMFEHNTTGTWVLTSTIVAPDAKAGDLFGASVALDGDHLAVGSPRDDDLGQDCGSVYLYTRSNSGGWNFVREVHASDAAPGDLFGRAVALQTQTLLVGAPLADEQVGVDSGAVYAFEPVDFTSATSRFFMLY